MKYSVVLEAPVHLELEETYLWIARDSPDAAAAWFNGCLDAIESLSRFPERCPLAPEDESFDEEIRHLIYGNFRILFNNTRQTVHVLHVRHGARRPLGPDTPD